MRSAKSGLLTALVVGCVGGLWAGAAAAQDAPPPPDPLAGFLAGRPESYALDLAKFWAYERLFINESEPVVLDPILQHQVIAKARPDQCFDGLGNPYLPIAFDPTSGEAICPGDSIPKTNQAYVWGLVRQGDSLWFGTIANTHCLVQLGYLGSEDAQANPYWVCDGGLGTNGLPKDWRPPRLYRYRVDGSPSPLYDLTPQGGMLLASTVGIRSAGAGDGVVLFAGPGWRGGLNFFAFDADTGTVLGTYTATKYNDIRSWINVGGVLYTTVGADPAAPGAPGGYVLRWRGNKTTPFVFEEVGVLDSMGANIAEHEGRLYVTTWPEGGEGPGDFRSAGLFRGPPIPAGGLTAAHKAARYWTKIWKAEDYDPDPIAMMSTGGGALASFEGALFWGTMHVPMVAATRALGAHQAGQIDLDTNGNGTLDLQEILATALGSHRSITIFQIKHPEKKRVNVQVIYGEYFLPKYDPAKKSYTIEYDLEHVNNLRKYPRFGCSGFGNFWNNYTWIMQPFQGNLYVGTFDWSQLVRVMLQEALGQGVSMTPAQYPWLVDIFGSNIPVEGADLFRIKTVSGKARAESLDGLGNFTNYGFRTVLVDGETMYIGSANPMNLHPFGGWELIETRAQ